MILRSNTSSYQGLPIGFAGNLRLKNITAILKDPLALFLMQHGSN